MLGAALLFWGWQCDLWLVAGVMAVGLESARWVPARWEFSETDFRRVWDFCAFLFLASLVYALTANEGLGAMREALRNANLANQRTAMLKSAQSALDLFKWMPILFFLIVLVQRYSQRGRIPLTVFSGILRRRQWRTKHEDRQPDPGLDTGYPYFAAILISAAVPHRPGLGFFGGLCLLLGWALWEQRSRRYPPAVWGMMLAGAIGLGYLGLGGLYRLHKAVDELDPQFLLKFRRASTDPRKIRTALGELGRLKLSGRIMLWLENKGPGPPPRLLREATYRLYSASVWRNPGGRDDFQNLPWETNETSWVLLPPKPAETVIGLSCFLPGGQGLLPLPHGVVRLDRLPVFTLKTNRLGAVLVEAGPAVAEFEARWGPGATLDAPPSEEDSGALPERDAAAVEQISTELGLAALSGPEVLKRIRTFFEDHFKYTVVLQVPMKDETGQTPLSRFLLDQRAGHCEFFATAATLLLRQAGIPARYAVGYSVQESSGSRFVVRERHAHSWCLAWLNGAWREFDPTPGGWVAAETLRASPWEVITDRWSRVWYEFSKWRYGQTGLRRYLGWIIVPVLVLLVIQLIRQRGWRRSGAANRGGSAGRVWPGLDSEFYRVQRRLGELGLGPMPGEPMRAWLRRLQQATLPPAAQPLLATLLALHYRYRFDPLGLEPADRDALREQADQCLARLNQPSPK